jgi:hypothetical protein
MQPQNTPDSKVDDWAYLITVLAGPFSLLIAAVIALVAALAVPQPERAKDLMQFATLLFGGGAAVTGTTQPRRAGSARNVNNDAEKWVNQDNISASEPLSGVLHTERSPESPVSNMTNIPGTEPMTKS